MRVGLEVDQSAITVRVPEGTQLLSEGELIRKGAGEVQVLAPISVTSTRRFWVQIGAPSEEIEAVKLLREFQKRGFEGKIRWNGRLQRHQVRLGPYSARSRAEQIRRRATPDAFVAMETSGLPSLATLRVGDETWDATRFELRPDTGHFLRYNNHSYRGWFEILVNDRRTLTLVNVVELEDYVKGVVPNELSPYLFPQMEALKAQAVAARTYAIRNRGQYASDGFDLFATLRSQVYGGMDSERELSNYAVQGTEGLIATYNDEPIEAVYSSACGGHTEDSSNVFSSKDVPYLRGIVCVGEKMLEKGRGLTIPAEEGLEFYLGLVHVAGVDLLPQEAQFYSQSTTVAEMRTWTRRVASLSRRPVAPLSDVSFEHFLLWLSKAHGEREAEVRYTPRDASVGLKDFDDLDLIDLEVRPHVAWLLERKILEPQGKRLIPALPLRKGYVLEALGRLLDAFHDQFLKQGRIERAQDGSLEISDGSKRILYALAPSLVLYRRENERLVPEHSLRVKGGERVRYFDERGALKLLIVEENASGNSSVAPYAYWEYRISQMDLSRRISSLVPVGQILDLIPLTYGVSGRVLKLRVVSNRGQIVLSGARLKTALGLRDTLFTLERSVNQDGVEQFVFRGRGWGHGVGLCQMGSVGLALQGKGFVEILKSYYTGIEVKPMGTE
ncbi:MAG: SpoIID/LytB domain-containing protein [Acidobacteria bacterium]|nr:SpoIID/LytB domain-containing protein [Acidobacteriota bacterium]